MEPTRKDQVGKSKGGVHRLPQSKPRADQRAPGNKVGVVTALSLSRFHVSTEAHQCRGAVLAILATCFWPELPKIQWPLNAPGKKSAPLGSETCHGLGGQSPLKWHRIFRGPLKHKL